MKDLSRSFPVLALLAVLLPAAARADCSTIDDPIDTDRPSSPDDSPTVPVGSLQIESGVGVARGGGVTSLDLPQSRLRLGVRSCTEFLVGLPDYTRSTGGGARGIGDLAAGIKHQFEDLPEPFQLWAEFGLALPTGARNISGRGALPYIEIPASVDLEEGLTLAAQYVATFHPGDVQTATEHGVSLDLAADISESVGLFVEYNGTYRPGERPQNTADLGGTYSLDNTHQLDFLVGKGLNAAAPAWYVSIGYSLRFDQLF
jgi:hypothetical protein